VTGETQDVLDRLAERAAGQPPEAPLHLYCKVLAAQAQAEELIAPPPPLLSAAEARDRSDRSQPLLSFADLRIDWRLVRSTLETIGAIVAQFDGAPGEVSRVVTELGSSEEALARATKSWFEAPAQPSADETAALGDLLLQAALKPFLVRHRDALIGLVDQERWRRPACPVCGGAPDFAFINQDGTRWLLCGRCEARWLFQRVGCPYCGAAHPDDLAFFAHPDGVHRLYVCEQCRRYLKAIDLRQAREAALLPLERLMTADLDLLASEMGYAQFAEPAVRH